MNVSTVFDLPAVSTSRSRYSFSALLLVVAGVLLTPHSSGQTPIPAFPGAEGFGSTTPGGRGGVVLFVTNLQDSGPGSLRAALEASGPRIVVFRTGGTIFLNTAIVIGEPYVTIAGQTAPGGGIAIANEPIRIKTHDVIVRGIRSRAGDLTGFAHPIEIESIHMIGASNPVYNVIIDHCSFSWGLDKNVGSWGEVADFGNVIHDITVQWCISSEALHSPFHPEGPDHAMGMFFSGVRKISAHHNLMVHNHARQPQFSKMTEGEGINNVVYNYGTFGTEVSAGAKVSLIRNYYKTGVDWTGSSRGINVDGNDLSYGNVSVYVLGNVGPGRALDEGDDWDAVTGDAQYRSFVPPVPLSGVVSNTAAEAYELVIANAGAHPRDAVDLRAVYDIVHATGEKITSQTDVGGWPTLAPGAAPLDTDNDGMPNAWETANGLNPNNPSDANGDQDGDGYLNIEECINSLIVPQRTVPYANVDQVLCGTTTATLQGNQPLLGTGAWRVISGTGTITTPSSPTTTVTGLSVGESLFEWRITYDGSSGRDTVKITIDPAPTVAQTGADRTLCNLTQTTLSANVPVVGAGLWRVLTGPATIVNPSNPLSAVAGLQIGLNEFEWSITGAASCPVTRDTMRITVDALPTVANAGPDDLTCTGTEIMAANRPTTGAGFWNVLVGPAVLADPTAHNSTVSGLQPGVNEFEWVISNGVCPPSRDTVVITAQISPVSDFSYAINGLSVDFNSLAANGDTYLWNFGDGTSSSLQNPTHTYSSIRSYRVTHTAGNDCGAASKRKRVSLAGLAGVLNVSPTTIDFGGVPAGSSMMSTFTISNTGTDTLDVEPFGADLSASAFSVNQSEFPLPPGDTRVITVTFAPDSAIGYSASLALAANETTTAVFLRGTGIGVLQQTENNAKGSVDFGEVPVGDSRHHDIVLFNAEPRTVRVENVDVIQKAPAEYSIEEIMGPAPKQSTRRSAKHEPEENTGGNNIFPLLLHKRDTLVVRVRFSPMGEHTAAATLRIITSIGSQSVFLTASGITVAVAEGKANNDSAGVNAKPGGEDGETAPESYSLKQNYPNPFNNSTNIRFSLKNEGIVSLRVYNTLGEEVATLADDYRPAGLWQSHWDGRDGGGRLVSSGVYIYRLQSGDFVETKRMILIR
jgi:PKD repeat protein